LFRNWPRKEISMWKITLTGATALGLAAAAGGPALACHGCDPGYVGYGSYFAFPNRARFGFHEYYGFYDSGYKASPDGGFHSVVGPQRFYGVGKRRGGVRGARNK
jgi:hypothetical protein